MAHEQKKRRVIAQNSLHDTSDTSRNLIYVPMYDLMSSDFSHKKSLHGRGATIQKENKVDNGYKKNEQLLLMQLPPKGLTIQDMLSTNPIPNEKLNSIRPRFNVQIIGGQDESGSGSTASIVIEKTGRSYTLNKVETSNSFIVIPPNASIPINNQENATDMKNTITKKYARLIANPSSSFLELKPRGLNRQHLWNILNKHVYNPLSLITIEDKESDEEIVGISLNELALRLHCSHKRMFRALEDMGTYQLPATSDENKQRCNQKSPPIYCILDEEIEISVTNAIISALVEMDDDKWLSSTSISGNNDDSIILEQDTLIKRVIKYLQEEDYRVNAMIDSFEHIILHCLKKISKIKELKNDDIEKTEELEDVSSKKHVHFDIEKVC